MSSPVSGGDFFKKKKQESVRFPGGKNRILYDYYEKDGQKIPHGTYREYLANGTVLKSLKYKNGMLHGSAKEFYPSKKIKWKGSYRNNVKTGRWIMWNKYGEKKVCAVFDRNGVILKMTHYHSNGRKKKMDCYIDGKISRTVMWDITGEIIKNQTMSE